MKRLTLLFGLLSFLFIPQHSDAQLLKKLKDKANEAVNKAIGTNSSESNSDNSGSSTDASDQSANSSGSGKPVNKGGAGLKNSTPPDVNAQLADAEKSFQASQYSDARYSLQQALRGIEIQLGRELLTSLPSAVSGLQKDTTQDKVMSTNWGWNNLTIQRVYSDQKDKQLTVTIGNNLLYSGLVNAYFNNAYGMQADADNQNVKQTKVKGNKAIIEYDDSKGYSLIVPIGQSSMIVWEAINFANEDEVMAAANSFDIDSIKQNLGEK